MPIRKRSLLISLVAISALLGTAAVAYWDRWPAWDSDPQPQADTARFGDSPTPYAYITEDRLVVVREGRIVAEVERLFDPADEHANTLVWTHDGDYVAMFSDNRLRMLEVPEELIVVDTRTGAVQRTPCVGCTDLAAIGDHAILVSDYKGQGGDAVVNLTEYDPVALDRPASVTAFGHGHFLSSTREHVLSYTTSWQDNDTSGVDLRLANADSGEVAVAGWVGSNTYLKSAALTGNGDRPDQFAVAYTVNPGMCFSSYPVVIFEADGNHTETDASAAAPLSFVPDVSGGGMEVEDLWWDFEGRLHASISTWTCDPGGESQADQKVAHESMQIWRLEGTVWVASEFPPAAMMEQLDEHTYLRLGLPDCIGDRTITDRALNCNIGELQLWRDGTDHLVAEDVIAVSTPSR
jgi:hypothetical protein